MVRCLRCLAENADDSRSCSRCAAPLDSADPAEAATATSLERAAPAMPAGTLVAGKYRVLAELGRGGMGVVYKAEDMTLQRPVALKFLPPHLLDSAELRERFLIEARAAAVLSHPNVCVVHEVGSSGESPYIAMEFVEGQTLRDRLGAGALAPRDALAIAGQVAAGLGEAHRKGIVHRDIKSPNIMVTAQGQAKVMDFGLAKVLGGSSLTKSRTTLGTVAYMSPEQARGEELDHRTDIWSLGVVLYEMLAGALPFKGDHDQTVIHGILHREPKWPSRVRPGLPAALDDVVRRALAKDRHDRYQTTEELRADLDAVSDGLQPRKARQGTWRRLGRRTALPVLGSALVALLILLALNAGGVRDRMFGGGSSVEPAVRLAVLPFVNLSGDPAQEVLSDGLTQELITLLGRLQPDTLRVIGRTSVMRYKGKDTSIDQIGRELGVSHVLGGSLKREANRVRITVELLETGDQTQLWADVYEQELSSIMMIQSQLALGVARALAVRLLPAEQARLSAARTVDPEAYEAYLKGFALWQGLKAADLDEARGAFELALERDPSYAPAHAGLAFAWMASQQMRVLLPSEGVPEAKAAALQAVALDEGAGVAHAALAVVLTWGEWNWARAEAEWTRALELDPNAPYTHAFYAHFLAHRGRAGEGVRHSDIAIKLDPFNALYHALRGEVLLYLRRFDDALAEAGTAASIRPDLGLPFGIIQKVYIAKGMRGEQLAEQRVRISRYPERVAAFERGLADDGYEGAQRALADLLAAQYERSQYRDARGVALRYLDAGDNDRAIEWLYKAFDAHHSSIPYLNQPPWTDRLRDDPRYQALLRRVGIPVDQERGP